MTVTYKVILWLSVLLVISCSHYKPYQPPPVTPDDRWDIVSQPQPKKQSLLADGANRQIILQGDQLVDPGRGIRQLTGEMVEAFNIDGYGAVSDNSWFTNRLSITPVGEWLVDSVNWNPPVLPLTINVLRYTRHSPEIDVTDADEQPFTLRFDHPDFPELATGTEAVAARFLYCAGYNTPEVTICNFSLNDLIIPIGMTVRTPEDKLIRLAVSDLRVLLQPVMTESGQIRSSAIRQIKGEPLGAFLLYGTRKDDPNDFIPHEHRREIRGLRTIAAWLNYWDIHTGSTMDYFVSGDSTSLIRHYFTRFGSAMGSYILGTQPPARGWENYVDPHAVAFSTLCLGLVVHPWEKNVVGYDPKHLPGAGFFTAERFDPDKFKFVFPAPPFENATDRDDYWATKIVAGFSDDRIRQIVRTGTYSDSAVVDYLSQVLIRRRDIIGKNCFKKGAPLDNINVQTNSNRAELEFTDLAVQLGYRDSGRTVYRADINRDGLPLVTGFEWSTQTRLTLPKLQSTNMGGQWEVVLSLREEGEREFSPPVKVYLEFDANNRFTIVGIHHCSK